jgi:glycosyltransferase involved in cell wall biosynthesis
MSRRVAIVFPFRLESFHLGKDLFLIPEGLRRLGFEVELHCPAADRDVVWPLPVHTAGPSRLQQAEHYSGRGLSGAIVFSFLHYPRLLAAVRDAGLTLVAKGDTTGQTVARAHPRATLTHALFDQPTLAGRAVSLAGWLVRIGPLAGRDARELQWVLRLADATVVETRAARDAVAAALARAGADHLAARLHVVGNPVADVYTRASVPAEREKLVVAVGRWDLAAKDAPLLAKALDRFLAERPDHRVVIVGHGREGGFGAAVERVAHLSQKELGLLFARARIVVTSSRWESYSLTSHEGLAMGCTVVGPVLQPLRDIVAAGDFGTTATRRDAAGLADALNREAAAWDAGRRDPLATAGFWRPRLAIDAVGRRYADLLASKLPLSRR